MSPPGRSDAALPQVSMDETERSVAAVMRAHLGDDATVLLVTDTDGTRWVAGASSYPSEEVIAGYRDAGCTVEVIAGELRRAS